MFGGKSLAKDMEDLYLTESDYESDGYDDDYEWESEFDSTSEEKKKNDKGPQILLLLWILMYFQSLRDIITVKAGDEEEDEELSETDPSTHSVSNMPSIGRLFEEEEEVIELDNNVEPLDGCKWYWEERELELMTPPPTPVITTDKKSNNMDAVARALTNNLGNMEILMNEQFQEEMASNKQESVPTNRTIVKLHKPKPKFSLRRLLGCFTG